MVVRFFMLQAHYRSVLDFSSKALDASEKGFNKLMEAKKKLNKIEYLKLELNKELDKKINKLCLDCYQYMNDDFNTPKTIATLFDLVAHINSMNTTSSFGTVSVDTFAKLQETFNGFINNVMGLEDNIEKKDDITKGLIEILLDMRNNAKINKNYELSDNIRDQLVQLGVNIKDSKDKTTYTLT